MPLDFDSMQMEMSPIDRQVMKIFTMSSPVVFKYITFDQLMTQGYECQELMEETLKSILTSADNAMEKCNIAVDAKCLDEVKQLITKSYASSHEKIVECVVEKAKLNISKKNLDEISDAVVENTIAVVTQAKTVPSSSIPTLGGMHTIINDALSGLPAAIPLAPGSHMGATSIPVPSTVPIVKAVPHAVPIHVVPMHQSAEIPAVPAAPAKDIPDSSEHKSKP